MKKTALVIAFLMVTQISIASPPSEKHHYITQKIAKYLTAAERCAESSKVRELPDEDVLAQLDRYQPKDVERFLITRSFLLLKECEKPELTDLAYAILVLEDSEISEETQKTISAIKVLAFASQNREFEKLYESLPEDMRNSLEKVGYFNEPFSNKKLRSMTQKP